MTIKGIAELFNVAIEKIQEIIDKLGISFLTFSHEVEGEKYTTEVYSNEDVEKIGKELHSIKDIELSDFNLRQGLDFNPRE